MKIQLKSYKPKTAGTRHRKILDLKHLVAEKTEKSLLGGKKKNFAGRNNRGSITIRRRGGGTKTTFRFVSNRSRLLFVPEKKLNLSYTPHRSGLLKTVSFYSLFNKLTLASTASVEQQTEIRRLGVLSSDGDRTFLKDIPTGTMVHAVENCAGRGATFSRSAGAYGIIVQSKDSLKTNNATSSSSYIRFHSGYFSRLLDPYSLATVGRVSLIEHKLEKKGKAGASRWISKRPSVRGVAMNPVDHPHGGRTSRGRPSSTPWGRPTKGFKTVRKQKNKKHNAIIV